MNRTILFIYILFPLLGKAQPINSISGHAPSLIEKIQPYLGEEMIVTSSFKTEQSFGVILIEESHIEQKDNTLFLARLVEHLNIRQIGLEGLSFAVPYSKSIIPKKHETEYGLFRAYCFNNFEDDYDQKDEQYKLSNAEFLYLNYDSILLIPIENEQAYNRFDFGSFESPAYYLQRDGPGVVKEKDIEFLSSLLAADWVSLQKYTNTLQTVKNYFNDRYKSKLAFSIQFNALLKETIDFNLNAMHRDVVMTKAVAMYLTSEQEVLPVIIGAAHTYNFQRLLKSKQIPFVTVMSSTTALQFSFRKKHPPEVLIRNFNKHIEEKALYLLMSNSFGDTAQLQDDSYFRNVCENFQFIDPNSIQVTNKSKRDTNVIRYSFRWKNDAHIKKRKITLRQIEGDELVPQQSYKDILHLREQAVALSNKIGEFKFFKPGVYVDIGNYQKAFDIMADAYIKKLQTKGATDSTFEGHLPNYPHTSTIESRDHFFYNNVATINGRLNYCVLYERQDEVDSLSGVITSYLTHNAKKVITKTLLLINGLDGYFNDPMLRLKDLGIHIIVSNGASGKKKITKALNEAFELKKAAILTNGITCNLFLRIDFIE